ncbi:MAG: hypothetical protein KJ732_04700 [Candidatus Margulisbacteria bacterium]|nr:hypothetical protein [Candidatus Margulisiibacteriota bacterium]
MRKKFFFSFLLIFFSLQITSLAQGVVRGYVFYSPTCPKCLEINQFIAQLQNKYPLEVKHFNIEEDKNYETLVLLEEKYQVSRNEVPEIFIGSFVLAGKAEIMGRLEAKIKLLLDRGGTSWPNQAKADQGKVVVKRFESFNLIAVLLAGLVDGINPCAFATIVFFISFLSFTKRRRREILLVGIFFSAAVFVTYLLIGLGAFKFLRALEIFTTLSKSIYKGIGVIALGLGAFSLYDYFKIKAGKISQITLQLPRGIKRLIHSVIRINQTSSGLALTAIVTGFSVSVLESICTGQVYLPTIVFVLKTPGMQTKAFTYLILYNLMFIAPLVMVFGLTFFGVTSDKFGKIMNKNTGMIKLLTAALFFGLGITLLII